MAGKKEHQGEIEKLRARIAELNEEIDALRKAPLTPDEALDRLDQTIEAAAERYRAEAPYMRLATGEEQGMRGLMPNTEMVVPFLAFVAGDSIRERIGAELSEHCQEYSTGGDLNSRAARVRELEDERLDLERQEESHLEAARAQGITIHRRPDASPAAILGE